MTSRAIRSRKPLSAHATMPWSDELRRGSHSNALAGLAFFAFHGTERHTFQFRCGENVDDPFGFISGAEVALDQHLDIAGDGAMLMRGDALDAVPDVRIEAHGDSRAGDVGGIGHGGRCASL